MISAPKTYSRKANQTASSDSNFSYKSSNDESEKENKGRIRQTKAKTLRKVRKKDAVERSFDESPPGPSSKAEDVFDKLLSSPPKVEVNFKPLSFWGQKVKQLDEQNSAKNQKKAAELFNYFDSDSDESYTGTRKKKVRKKPTARKNKPGGAIDLTFKKMMQKKFTGKAIDNNQLVKPKTAKPHEGTIIKERVLKSKELERLKDKENKFTFDKSSSSLGITSTPENKRRINLAGTSDFNFVSPIAPEETPKCDISSILPEENPPATPVAKGKRRKTKMVSDENEETLKNEEEEGSSEEFPGFESKDLVKPSFFFSNQELSLKKDSDSDSSFKSACSHCSDSSLIKSDDLHKKGDLLLQLKFAGNLNFRKFYVMKYFFWDKLNFKSSDNIPRDLNREEADFYYSDNEGIERFNRDRIRLKSEIVKKEELLEEESFGKNVTMRRRYQNFSRVGNRTNSSELYTTVVEESSRLENLTNSSELYTTVLEESGQYPKIVLERTLTPNLSTGSDSSVASSPEMNQTVKTVRETPTKETPRKLGEETPNDTLAASPIPILESTCSDLKMGVSGKGVRASDWNVSRISEIPPILESTRVEVEEPAQNLQITLKPGKKWMRSLSVIHQLQNKTLVEENDGSSLKGRNYSTFVKEVAEMQNPAFHESILKISEHSRTINDLTAQFSNMSLSRKSRKILTTRGSTVERPSMYRTALNLVEEEEEEEELPDTDENDCPPAEATLVEDLTIKQINVAITPRDVVLARCKQEEPLPFSEYFNIRTLKNCTKIGEGVYGEVFMYNSDTVIKIIPIEGSLIVNGDRQKKFDEVLSEIVIAMELSNLRYGNDNRTTGFNELKRCWCVFGEYPDYLIELWEAYDQAKGSENDHPGMFQSEQLYIVLELAHGGKDLEAFVFNSAEQSYSVFLQTALSLAVAEKALDFEHRDLHWGNLLIKNTTKKFATFVIQGAEFTVPTNGVEVSIIDFTLSRMTFQECCIFNDLSVDPDLFTSQGDYQFEIYRLMQNEVMNDWSLARPKTNIFWLHYILDKMVTLVRYKKKTTKVHKTNTNALNDFKDVILEYNSSTDFVLEALS